MSPKIDSSLAAVIVNDRLRVRVKPGARKSALLEITDGVAHLAIAAPPEDGKANDEVERFLSRIAGRPAKITTGFTSKDKTVKFS